MYRWYQAAMPVEDCRELAFEAFYTRRAIAKLHADIQQIESD